MNNKISTLAAMETPTRPNNATWSSTEKELLEALLKTLFLLDEDPDAEQMNRDEIFRWMSNQFSARNFNRSAKAIARRLGGRLSFRAPRSPKTNTEHRNESLSTPVTDSLDASAYSRNRSTSSDDDIPLAQLRRSKTLLGTGSMFVSRTPASLMRLSECGPTNAIYIVRPTNCLPPIQPPRIERESLRPLIQSPLNPLLVPRNPLRLLWEAIIPSCWALSFK